MDTLEIGATLAGFYIVGYFIGMKFLAVKRFLETST